MPDPALRTRLPKRDLSLPAIGVGTASLGGLFGRVDDDAAVGLLRAMLDAGLDYIDTAPIYGNGEAERRVGRALAELGSPPVTISTKVGRLLDDSAPEGRRYDLSRDGILRSLESSLERLGRDRVDILYLHDPDDYEEEISSTAWPALEQLRDQGVVRAIGVGMNQWQLPMRLVQRLDVDLVMLAGRYTLLDPSAREEFLPTCQELGVGVVVAGVFNSGVLVRPVEGAWYDYAPASPEVLGRAQALEVFAAEHGLSLAALALRFSAQAPAAVSTVVGAGSARTLLANLAAYRAALPPALWSALDASGLVR